jgi:hypothetical protein
LSPFKLLILKSLSLYFKKCFLLFPGFFILAFCTLEAQEDWVEYVTMKDKGVMSIAIDLSFDISRPNYKNLLVVGTRYESCLKNGFPTEEGLGELFAFSDSTSAVIDRTTRNRLVGIITYQCIGFDVFYVKDTLDLRANLKDVIGENFNKSETYLKIEPDNSYDYYYSYLYPKNISLEYLINQKYLYDLVLQGDDLQGLRKVNHWIYFNNLKTRTTVAEQLKRLKFSLDSISYKKESKYPYELQISRNDSINPNSIYKLTTMLNALCASYKGKYDGWGTEVKVKE